MDYNSAKDILDNHASVISKSYGIVATHNPGKKLVNGNTWLTMNERSSVGLDVWTPEVGDTYVLEYFKNGILHFRKDFFTIDDHGWFAHSTHARLNDYMPRGFRVWGTTPKHLHWKDPLGYVKTPAGIFPYGMPMSFKYDGQPWFVGGPTNKANQAIHELGAYVENYLTRLLQKQPCDVEDSQESADYWGTSTAEVLSVRAADAIVGRQYFRNLAMFATFGEHVICEGLDIVEIVRVLEAEGATALKRVDSQNRLARHVENELIHALPLPVINAGWLRTTLRKMLHKYLIESLGFSANTWNRR